MSGVPMSSDAGHVFSGGTLSERGERADHEASGGHRKRVTPRSESVSYEAAECLGGTGEYRVLELPATVEVDGHFPSLESAQSHALALNEWVALRPDPAVLHPLFAPSWPERAVPSFEGLEAIFERGARPERMGL